MRELSSSVTYPVWFYDDTWNKMKENVIAVCSLDLNKKKHVKLLYTLKGLLKGY